MNDLVSRFYRLKTLKESCEKRIEGLEMEIAFLELDKDKKTEAGIILDTLAQDEVERGVSAYISLLEEGLKAIFPEQEVGLTAEIKRIRGKVAVNLKTTFKGQDGLEIEGLGMDAFGGAVTTIQSLLLRISLILKRNLRPMLILDETFPAVDENRVEILVDFLKVLCQRLGMDILCITHDPTIADNCDIGYKITPSKDGAKLKRIK
jgi:DNA repair exonuclease SbcCD ATPase subunit